MDRNVTIADSIKYQPQWYAFDIWMQQTFKRVDLSKLLIYFVDIVDAAVLPFLAQEFDVLGMKGWQYAINETQQRALIRKAVQLHRYKGTLWAVEQVIAQAGLTATVEENVGTDPDTGWAVFRIVVDTSVTMPDAEVIANAIALVNLYKPQRCVLEGITYMGLNFGDDDVVTMTEDNLVIDGDPSRIGDSMSSTGHFLYDGTYNYDGSRNYSQDTDTIIIHIIP